MERKLPLEGVKIVELSWIFTGPIATKILADHGAEVIKIESARRPDDVRGYGPYKDGVAGINRGAIFANYNSSKLGMTCDLHNQRGLELAKRLIARADVVVVSFSPGTLERLGLGYEEMRKTKPDIILISITMQGETGPDAAQPTFGTHLQGGAGFCHLTGWPDRPPIVPPTALTDFIHPMFVMICILGALDYRRRTGQGQHFDISQLEASLHFLAPALLEYTANRRINTRQGNRCSYAAPHGVYPCKGEDKWCAIAVASDEEWLAFCRVIGNPEWSSSHKFSTFLGRKKNEEELDRLIADWTCRFSPGEIMTSMQAAGVAVGVVQNGEDLLERDPQLRHRQHCKVLNHPEMGRHITEMAPFRLSASPGSPSRPAPCMGEHNEHVCKAILGLTDEEFIELLNSGVFD